MCGTILLLSWPLNTLLLLLFLFVSGTSSVVHLVCNDNAKNNGSFKFVLEDKQRKVFVSENLF